jgi:hypothetical protein
MDAPRLVKPRTLVLRLLPVNNKTITRVWDRVLAQEVEVVVAAVLEMGKVMDQAQVLVPDQDQDQEAVLTVLW